LQAFIYAKKNMFLAYSVNSTAMQWAEDNNRQHQHLFQYLT